MEPEKHESDLTRGEKRKKRLETIRSLHGRKRAEYLWMYYKSWLLAAILLAAGIFVLVYSYQNRHTRVLLSLAVADVSYGSEENTEALRQDLLEALGSGSGRETVSLDTSVRSGDDSAMALKRMVVVGAGRTDLFLCGEETYREYLEQDAFLDWREALGSRYGEYQDLFKDGRLDLSESSRWESYGLTSYEPVWVGVLQGTDRQDAICRFLDFFFP